MGNAEVRLVGKRLMVRVEQPKKKSDGGIFIPDAAVQSLKDRGQVTAVSKEVKVAKVGDIVYFVPFMAVPLEISGKPYFVVEEKDVIGVFTPPELGEDQCQTQTKKM